MELTRSVFEDFLKWKNSADRKPLIVEGARQIGKTWAMKRFGELHYKHTAYFNFESSEDLGREFEKTKDPRRILDVLQLYANQEIVPGDTLVIFDEIQQCNKALNSLKYFCETAPEYHIMAAGSLLGVSLSKGDSFPVGKVQFLSMLHHLHLLLLILFYLHHTFDILLHLLIHLFSLGSLSLLYTFCLLNYVCYLLFSIPHTLHVVLVLS